MSQSILAGRDALEGPLDVSADRVHTLTCPLPRPFTFALTRDHPVSEERLMLLASRALRWGRACRPHAGHANVHGSQLALRHA